MDPNQQSALFRMDMRGPSRAAECLDGVVAFPAAVERMRANKDESDFARAIIEGTRVAFKSLEPDDLKGMLFIAASAQDILYRHVMQLSILDRYTLAYSSLAVRCFFDHLAIRGFRTLYILDNTLRDDRLEATLEIFGLSGIVTTTPRRDGFAWPALAARLRASLDSVGHAVYIEPDATVNHLDAARQLAAEIPCIATFRNAHPDENQYEVINFQAPNAA